MTTQKESDGRYSLVRPDEELSIEIRRMDWLNESDRNQIVDFVTWNNAFDSAIITRAQGRNVFFPMIQPIEPYDTIQISGAGFFDIGIVDNAGPTVIDIGLKPNISIRPPQRDSSSFTHKTSIIEYGSHKELVQESPLGSYAQTAAGKKYRITNVLYNLVSKERFPFFVPLPITKVYYPELSDGVGGKQTALVFACPLGGERGDDLLSRFVNTARTYKDITERERYVQKTYPDTFNHLMLLAGSATRFLHDRGFCHYQITLGNVSPVFQIKNEGPRICLYDWETLRPVDTVNPHLAKTYDMSVTIASSASVLRTLFDMLDLSEKTMLGLGFNSLLSYLCGYTGQTQTNLSAVLNLTVEEVARVSLGTPGEIVDDMTRVVLPRLKDYIE